MNARRFARPGDLALKDTVVPGSPHAGEAAQIADQLAAYGHVIGDLERHLRFLTATPVLGTATYALNAAGIATDVYRTPYRALAITSASAAQLTLASSPQQSAAPGPGPGSHIVPKGGFIVVNIGPGYAWTLYGGAPGELVSVQAFSVPQPPSASG